MGAYIIVCTGDPTHVPQHTAEPCAPTAFIESTAPIEAIEPMEPMEAIEPIEPMEAMEAKIGCVARARRQQKALEIITEAAAALSAMPQAKELAARILSAAETIKE